MIGVGIDLGTSTTKGAAIRVNPDGSLVLLEAVAVPSAEIGTRATELVKRLGRHRNTLVLRPPLACCLSSPEITFDRIRLPLGNDVGEMEPATVRTWLEDGTLAPPPGAKLDSDLWDFQTVHLYRRADDLERFGRKSVEGLFAKIPGPVASAERPSFKPLVQRSLEPAIVAAVNACLALDKELASQTAVILNLGMSQAQAVIVVHGAVMRVASVPMTDLAATVARTARVDPSQVDQRIFNADLSASDAVTISMKNFLVRALQRIPEDMKWHAEGTPTPERVILCGGLAGVPGMSAHLTSLLKVEAAPIAEPATSRSAKLPGVFAQFAGATGAALRAAGRPSLTVLPRKSRYHVAPVAEAKVAEDAAAVRRRPSGPLGRFDEAVRRAGWSWVAAGALALAAVTTMATWIGGWRSSRTELAREIELLAPESEELARQARLIERYAALAGAPGIALTPWGGVVADVAGRLPDDTYLTSLEVNRDRMAISGRIKGSTTGKMRSLVSRLRKAPTMKRSGLIPPVI